MTPGPVRRGLHGVHALTAIGLVLTGILILYPDLRTRTIGGYGREVGSLHVYVGLLFVAAPVLALALAPRQLLAGAWHRVPARGAGSSWRRIHIVVSLAASGALVVTGLVLWLADDLPLAYWDAADRIHVYGHWVVTGSLPIHLVAARRRIAERLRIAFGAEPPELFEFADPTDDEA